MIRHVKPEYKQAVLDLPTAEIVSECFLELWEKWGGGALAQVAYMNIPGKIIAKHTGCTPTAPYALMFTAFCLGVEAGIAEADPAEGTGGKCKQ